MSVFNIFARPRRRKSGNAPRIASASQMTTESLEKREVPTVAFTPLVTAPTVTDGGGQVLKDTPVYLIYWGSSWGNTDSGKNMRKSIDDATRTMLDSGYLSGLDQYRPGIGKAHFARSVWDSSDPVSGFSTKALLNRVQNGYNELGLPDPDDIEPTIPLYLVVTPAGVTSGDGPGTLGYHTWVDEAYDEFLDWDDVYFGWVGNDGTKDFVTSVMSHEIVESLTNPKTTGGITATVGGDGELSDGEAQNFAYRVDGALLQSYWSRIHGSYVVPDGNNQILVVNNGVLSVNGDQRLRDFDPTSANDQIAIGKQGNSVTVTLNGEFFQFEPGQISQINVFGLTGIDQIRIDQTLANVPVTVNGGSSGDLISVGGGNVDGLNGAVKVNGANDGDVLYFVDNQTNFGDQYTITSGSVTRTTPGNISLTRSVAYSGLGGVVLLAQNGPNSITVSSVNATTNYLINGGGGMDTLIGRNAAQTWTISGVDRGIVGKVAFETIENLTGGINADVFAFSTAGRISGSLNGGSGDNWLDYSGFTRTTGVTVDLTKGIATSVGTGVGAAVTAVNNVRGSKFSDTLTGNSSPNILVGMAGNDTLRGMGGRDLL
ncbi:MAG: hypothetical protein KDB01_20770, partial [Planctomycetaceae bacterium]|nr:hypothetical protein [Planctomycetaceae bacterium]